MRQPTLLTTRFKRRFERSRSGDKLALSKHRRAAMPSDMRDNDKPSRGFRCWRTPLFRLLAINLAAGVAAAVLLVCGLLLLNPGGLRHLIFADRTPGIALGLLLFGFIVTFGSAAMGSAIMAAGLREGDDDAPRGPQRLAAQEFSRKK
jgi:hypothetical protein